MKFIDLLRMSSSNLWKRKVRTILTVLGVVIGVAAIVVMVSLGLGLSKSLMEQYESYGSLTQVTIQQPWNSGEGEPKYLNEDFINQLLALEHVESVYPVLTTSAIASYGQYQGYLEIQALPKEAFEDMSKNIKIAEGRLPIGDDQLKFFYGSTVLQNFYNAKNGSGGYWETGILPDIDLMKDPIFVVFDTDSFYQSQGGSESGQAVKPPKKYLIPACGVEEAMQDGWSQYGWYTYCDLDLFKAELKRIYKNKPIPGQPTTKSGKPFKDLVYNELRVNIDSMDHVVETQKMITEMGYEAYSNAEWVESEQKTMGYIEAVLGGIGAVSLLVAAIGITNTMMMSIYERTKEIGVMKVLGCDMQNIRTMFLMEAGFIGFIGGGIGLMISLILSFVINKVASKASEFVTGISYIPVWLMVSALVFAVLVGMVAGFFPARRAMKLSPLAAIRNE